MTHMGLLALVSAMWVLSEVVLSFRLRSAAEAEKSDRGSFTAIWVLLAITITAGSMIRGFRPARIPNASVVFWVGIALILAGICIRIAAIITLGRFFTVKVAIQQDHKVVDRGLYSVVRHPSYSGSLISFLGLGLAFGNWLSLAIILSGALIAFAYRIRVEEAALTAALGDDYRQYAARTKRLIPGVYCLAAAVLFASHANAAEVLVLGTFHMANPGHDINNVNVDDVLAPKRQAEIAQVIEVLKKFNPTKVAIETDPGSKRIASQYADYLAGKYELTRNEIDQIGYRLAKELGHKTIYGVDADGDFPWMPLLDYVKAHDRQKEFETITDEWAERTKAEAAFLASHTILETLLTVNSDPYAKSELASYSRIPRFSEPYDWAGADLLADWYRRNIHIYSNVLRLIESPDDRILVIFGSGHLAWLRQDFEANPDIRLRKLAEFTTHSEMNRGSH